MFGHRRRSRLNEIAKRNFEKKARPGMLLWLVGVLLPSSFFMVHIMGQEPGAPLAAWIAFPGLVYACASYYAHELLKARTDMEGGKRILTALAIGLPVSAGLVYLTGTPVAPYSVFLLMLPVVVYLQYRKGDVYRTA